MTVTGLPARTRALWILLGRDAARESAADELRQFQLCRIMWSMRHLGLAALLAFAGPLGEDGRARVLLAVAVVWGLVAHGAVSRAPRLARAVTFADVGAVVVLAAAGLPPAAVILTAVAILGWAATFRPLPSICCALGAVGAVVIAEVVGRTPSLVALAGFCMLAAVFTVRMVRLSIGGRLAEERERRVEEGIDAILWEEIPGLGGGVRVSAAAERLLGYPAEAWREPGFWERVVHPEDRPLVVRHLAERREASATFRCIAADGRELWVENRVSRVADRSGPGAVTAGILIDRTETILAEREALMFGHLVSSSPIGQVLLACRGEGPVVEALNDAACRVLGVGPDAAGRRLADLASARSPVRALATALGHRLGGPAEVEVAGADGRVYQATLRPVGDAECSVDFLDVTQRVEAGRLLHAQARQDELTGLPNRRAFLEALDGVLVRRPDDAACVLTIDLDDFKDVNDSLGHATGDELLRGLGAKLAEGVRPGDVLARLGGDEFSVLLPGVDAAAGLARARTLAALINEPVRVGEMTLRVRASIGVAAYPGDGADAGSLLVRADLAMYEAKAHGSGAEGYQGRERTALDRLALTSQLDQAIAGDELLLHHQPLVDLGTGRVVGTEALARWRHPDLGVIAPDAFIGVAEASGQIAGLTRWVVARALADLRSLGEEGDGLDVSVNLSVRNLYEADLLPWILGELARARVSPTRLVVEITESVMMDNDAAALDLVRGMREHGIRVWIDDFGTGHSSLSRLRTLPVDGVKIDRSFVAGAAGSASGRALLSGLLGLVGSLGLQAIAEGVEDEEVLALLTGIGCPTAQGFLLGRPMPLADLRGRLLTAPAAALR